MYNFTYETQGANTYMVYEFQDTDTIDTLSLGMLTNNRIEGFAPVLFTQMDVKKYIKYNISSKVPVEQYFTGVVNKKRLLGVFSSILSAMLMAEEYMLVPSSLLLEPNNIYVDVSTSEAVLICLPVSVEEEGTIDFISFFRNIMFTTQFDQTENCDYLARIINYLNLPTSFSLGGFKKLVEELLGSQVVEEPKVIHTVSQPVAPPTPQLVAASVPQHPAPQSVASPVPQLVVQPVPTHASPMVQEVIQPTNNNPQKSIKEGMQMQIPAQAGFAVPGMEQTTGGKKEKISKKEKTKKDKSKKEREKSEKEKSEKEKDKEKSEKKSWFSFGKGKKKEEIPSDIVSVPGQPNITGTISVPMPQGYLQPSMQPMVGTGMNFGETTVLGGAGVGETTVLGMGQPNNLPQQPHLLRRENNERIPINKPVFRMGKEKSYVDYFIGNNTAISRSHATIITKGEEYFIIDTNSTNHTYVDGGMIMSNTEHPLHHGGIIHLANEEFEFKVY